MHRSNLVQEIIDADLHLGGCKSLFINSVSNFDDLKHDCLQLVADNTPSNVTDKNHRTNWTNPYGEAKQWSLWNDSGLFDETKSINLNNKIERKFHYAEKYPVLNKFINDWPDKINVRINLLGPDSGLNQHEEQILHNHNDEIVIRIRFHLPLVTNENCYVFLDGEVYNYKEGNIYFFNNGCVHGAINESKIDRYHLVWDCVLTKRTLSILEAGKLHTSSKTLSIDPDYARYGRKTDVTSFDKISIMDSYQ